jgi:hypothetical protein
LLGAGFWFFSETLVQMSLYRFSICVQLFACIGAALLVCDCARVSRTILCGAMLGLGLSIAFSPVLIGSISAQELPFARELRAYISQKPSGLMLLGALICAAALHGLIAAVTSQRLRAGLQIIGITLLATTIAVSWRNSIGLTQIDSPADEQYLSLCAWAKRNTPTSAIFLVPPDESEFRYYAQRAIVVNFKAVPQLSSELREWQTRLKEVLGVDDLHAALPRGYAKIGPAMARLYAQRSADQLIDVAHKYHAGYVVTTRAYDDPGLRLVQNVGGRYLLYAVVR